MIQLELPWVGQRHPSEPLGSGGGWALLRPGSVNLVRSLRVATLENRTDRPAPRIPPALPAEPHAAGLPRAAADRTRHSCRAGIGIAVQGRIGMQLCAVILILAATDWRQGVLGSATVRLRQVSDRRARTADRAVAYLGDASGSAGDAQGWLTWSLVRTVAARGARPGTDPA